MTTHVNINDQLQLKLYDDGRVGVNAPWNHRQYDVFGRALEEVIEARQKFQDEYTAALVKLRAEHEERVATLGKCQRALRLCGAKRCPSHRSKHGRA